MTSTLAECSSHIRHNMTIYFYLYLYQLILCLVVQALVILVNSSGPYMCHRKYQMWCQGRCDSCQSAELRNIDHTQNGVRTNGITLVFGDVWRLASSFLCMSGSYFQR